MSSTKVWDDDLKDWVDAPASAGGSSGPGTATDAIAPYGVTVASPATLENAGDVETRGLSAVNGTSSPTDGDATAAPSAVELEVLPPPKGRTVEFDALLPNPSSSGAKSPFSFPLFVEGDYNDVFEEHVGPLVEDVNYDTTFRVLQIRQLERKRTGVYEKGGWLKLFATFIILILGATLMVVWAAAGAPPLTLSIIVVMVFVPVSLIIIWLTSARFKLLIWILVAAAIVYFILIWVYGSSPESDYIYARNVFFWVFVTVFGTLMLGYVFFFYVWPRVLMGDLKSIQLDVQIKDQWDIEPALGPKGEPTGFFKYRTYDGGLTRKTRYFNYRGQVNEKKQPHGLGEWHDDAYIGECMRGYFDNGIPVGPFISREFGTSNQFAAVRLVYWRNVRDKWDEYCYVRNPGGPAWGAARGECSVGGNFFSMYPLAEQLIAPTFPADEPDIVKKVFDCVAVGLPPVPAGVKREALIILHGMNSPLEYACGTYSQLMTLAKFPTHIIVPIMFSWPGGNLFSFKKAQEQALDPAWREEFKAFVKTLHDEQGFEIFHIINHSMGARVTVNMSAVFPEIFEQVGPYGELPDFDTDPTKPDLPIPEGPRKPRLMSITFLNGEGSIEEFRRMFPAMRSVCPIITAYGDTGDWALMFSRIITGEKMIGRQLDTLYVEPGDPDYAALGADREGTLKRLSPSQIPPSHRGGKADDMAFLRRFNRKYFDMDVISTDCLQTNVQALRHVYFQFNRQFMDDLREIIVDKRRARYRQNVSLREGNVYGFLNVPPYVTL
ncbi:hypothetical protein DFJ74DRAFT_694995 [Hyaloraphidium curvatum]|nr:hypothetical protein DFJ74DRAFT_694995 [Hyaloraphidium curvatum]